MWEDNYGEGLTFRQKRNRQICDRLNVNHDKIMVYYDLAQQCYDEALEALWSWQFGETCFSANLMRLISKADIENTKKLSLAFPCHVDVYLLYGHGKTLEELGW